MAGKRARRRTVAIDQHVNFPEKFVQDALKQKSTEGLPFGFRRIGDIEVECAICQVKLASSKDVSTHANCKPHMVRCNFHALRKYRKSLIENKGGISIYSEYDWSDGNIKCDIDPDQDYYFNIHVENNSHNSIYLLKCVLLMNVPSIRIVSSVSSRGNVEIKPGDEVVIEVKVRAHHIGRDNCPIAFMFSDELLHGNRTHIVRYISAYCTNELIKQLQPKSPYQPPPKFVHGRIASETVDGVPPPRQADSGLERDIELSHYRIPGHVQVIMNRGLNAYDPEELDDAIHERNNQFRNAIHNPLTMSNYKDKYSALLHVEEHQMNVDILKYNMEAATMDIYPRNRRLLTLRVPGLAENRPSLLKGDRLFVSLFIGKDKPIESKPLVEYVGYVHEVHECQVVLGFGQKLLDKYITNMKFNVRFTFSRHPLKLQHRAIQLAEEHSLEQLLFPTQATCCKRAPISDFLSKKLTLYDQKLEKNEQQFRAVRHILAGTSRPAPYIVFGPPGTGKTVTLVEAMKQIWKLIPNSHVLACAPSNSAADLLAERLIKHVDKAQVYRMHAASRIYKTIPLAIRECGNIDSEGDVHYPKKAELINYKFIVTTLTTAGRIASANFPSGHFSHVFIDESGHAVEPEAVIALAGIMESDIVDRHGGQVVLSGDPKQLGPILRSPVAKNFGLNVSLLERYMFDVDVYKKKEETEDTEDDTQHYDPNLITKLIMNYRSHPMILEVPNKRFYDNELKYSADTGAREALCSWSKLPKKGFPLLFHGIVGEDMREEKSPSFFNPQEVALVKDYVDELLAARGIIKLKQTDIGVITPYRKQVQKIRSVLSGNPKTNEIKVGSVEEFQGQERTVVIISTVRSNPDYLKYDSHYRLGFLRNPKRFNVAITRAKALLVVIGNPYFLASDPHWKELLDFIVDNTAYTGEDYSKTDNDSEIQELIKNFEGLDFLTRGVHISDEQNEGLSFAGSEGINSVQEVYNRTAQKKKKK